MRAIIMKSIFLDNVPGDCAVKNMLLCLNRFLISAEKQRKSQ